MMRDNRHIQNFDGKPLANAHLENNEEIREICSGECLEEMLWGQKVTGSGLGS
jgi:hypothetical protein